MTERSADVAVVGGGIVGLAHAYAAASAGKRVVLFERNVRASGASVRNFGLIWPIGQPAGPRLEMALESAGIWREVLTQSGLPFLDTGSLHLAHRDDERAVAQEFAERGPGAGYRCSWLTPAEALSKSPALVSSGLQGALWSETELTVDPRQVIAALPDWLATRHGVELRYGHPVRGIDLPIVRTLDETWKVEQALVCSGDDFETLYPEHFLESGIVRCKLQMMRTVPQPDRWQLGPALAGGLTLRFYPSFQLCSTLADLSRRVGAESPQFDKWGIHVMASQTPELEITIGDSHEYGNQVDIFNREEIDGMIIGYLRSFLKLPVETIAQRWYGVYAKHPDQPFVRFEPSPGATVVTALGGAGMTLSFGLGADTWRRIGK